MFLNHKFFKGLCIQLHQNFNFFNAFPTTGCITPVKTPPTSLSAVTIPKHVQSLAQIPDDYCKPYEGYKVPHCAEYKLTRVAIQPSSTKLAIVETVTKSQASNPNGVGPANGATADGSWKTFLENIMIFGLTFGANLIGFRCILTKRRK